MKNKPVGLVRWPKIRLDLIDANKRLNRIRLSDENYVASVKSVIATLEIVVAHLKQLVEEKEKANAEEV